MDDSPDDVLGYILDMLPYNILLTALLVCKRFYVIGHRQLDAREREMKELLSEHTLIGSKRNRSQRIPPCFIEDILSTIHGRRSGSPRNHDAKLKEPHGYDDLAFILRLHYRHGYTFLGADAWSDLLPMWELVLEHPTLMERGIVRFLRENDRTASICLRGDGEAVKFTKTLKRTLDPPKKIIKRFKKMAANEDLLDKKRQRITKLRCWTLK